MNETENAVHPALDALWDFALALYGDEGVEAACLRLQDEAGLDVVMLLYCLWAARERGRLGREAMERAVAMMAPWSTGVIAPLRAVRRRLKTAANAPGQAAPDQAQLRRAVGECERSAERIACAMLGAHLPPAAGQPAPSAPTARAEAAAANLADYLAAAGVCLRPPLAADLERLISAVT